MERDLEAVAVRCGTHGPGEGRPAGRQVRDRGQFSGAAVHAIADLHRVAAPGELQAKLGRSGRQVGDRPAGVLESDHGA